VPAEKTPSRVRKPLLALLGAGLVMGTPAEAARMYEWIDPDTGTVQLAGRPPPWYRTTLTGPRVRVIEHGRVIDDTAYAPPAPLPAPPLPAAASATTAPPAADSASLHEEFRALLNAWDREQAARPAAAPAPSAAAAPPSK